MATSTTAPTNLLMAVCYHGVRCGIMVCLIVPLSCNQWSLGGQCVVLAHFAAAALRASSAIGSIEHGS